MYSGPPGSDVARVDADAIQDVADRVLGVERDDPAIRTLPECRGGVIVDLQIGVQHVAVGLYSRHQRRDDDVSGVVHIPGDGLRADPDRLRRGKPAPTAGSKREVEGRSNHRLRSVPLGLAIPGLRVSAAVGSAPKAGAEDGWGRGGEHQRQECGDKRQGTRDLFHAVKPAVLCSDGTPVDRPPPPSLESGLTAALAGSEEAHRTGPSAKPASRDRSRARAPHALSATLGSGEAGSFRYERGARSGPHRSMAARSRCQYSSSRADGRTRARVPAGSRQFLGVSRSSPQARTPRIGDGSVRSVAQER